MAGKKHKDNKTSSNANIPNRDIMQRLNFLYQASVYLDQMGASQGGSDHSTGSTSALSSQDFKRRDVRTSDIARDYVKTLKLIGTKTNVRL